MDDIWYFLTKLMEGKRIIFSYANTLKQYKKIKEILDDNEMKAIIKETVLRADLIKYSKELFELFEEDIFSFSLRVSTREGIDLLESIHSNYLKVLYYEWSKGKEQD